VNYDYHPPVRATSEAAAFTHHSMHVRKKSPDGLERPPSLRTLAPQSGLGLIEVLIAIAILCVLGVVVGIQVLQ
jgi:prepilin-type N-terminal cleavage/methylation domain-containing protein